MIFAACGASVVGPRHLSRSEANQDAVLLAGCRGGWLAAVADGLGSRPLSGIGAREACRAARRVLRREPRVAVEPLLGAVHRTWLQAIRPRSADSVATTLILGKVDDRGRALVAQIGDGLALVREGGRFRCLTPPREGFGNETMALTAEHRPDRWSWTRASLSQPGDGLVLMTDGVGDDLARDGLPDFMEALHRDVARRGRRRGGRWLAAELTDWATPMHGDDKSLVAIFRISP